MNNIFTFISENKIFSVFSLFTLYLIQFSWWSKMTDYITWILAVNLQQLGKDSADMRFLIL